MLRFIPFFVLAVFLSTGVAVRADDAGVAYFEKHIRPVLVEHCYRCHSSQTKRLRGQLRLDNREAMRKGGKTGPAVIPGKPNESLLLQALRYQNLEMPPKGKLPPHVIAHFEKWIALGAPDPRTGAAVRPKTGIDWDAARKHWAFQPVRKPTLPTVNNRQWASNPVDLFVLAQLERHDLTPSPAADQRTLIRRAYYDLIGMPPSYDEVQAFIADRRPDAFARVLDRLLASPHYGERWGRHWLDVARYADTKDQVLVFGKDRIRPYAYTYRDYVVKAFNDDLPYNQFIVDQIAADRLQGKVEPWRLGAMGFLTLGRLFCNSLPDQYDDQIDTVTRGLLGLTVSCARCHDHKYDPIPTADYYSLYGIFAASERPLESPIIETPKQSPNYTKFKAALDQKRKQLQNHIDAQYRHINDLIRKQTPQYLTTVATEPPGPLENVMFFLSLSPNDLRPQFIANWRQYLIRIQPDDPVFGPWARLMSLSDDEFVKQANQIDSGKLNPFVRDALSAKEIRSKTELAQRYGELLYKIYGEASNPPKESPDRQRARRQLLEIINGPQSPFFFPKNRTFLHMSRVPRGQYGSFLQQIDRLAVDSPAAPARAMILVDSPQPTTPRIFIRGNPRRLGDHVPRRFLEILSPSKRKPFANGSGRLELARAIASPNNPLTARVLVNRVWMHHFGKPLVATPNDFGSRSDPPSHPQLLDYLASELTGHGWSLKKLHRTIMLSSAYQQSSFDRPNCRKTDPENRLLWRYDRRPLDLEAMRDSLLHLSGAMDRSMFGRSGDMASNPNNRRRTLYGMVDRQDLPNLFRVFNFASPDQSAGMRPKTTVPQQALFGLNSPFVIQQVKTLAARPDVSQNVTTLYHLILQRDPTAEEHNLAARFLAVPASIAKQSTLTPWQQYVQVLLLSNEMMFVE